MKTRRAMRRPGLPVMGAFDKGGHAPTVGIVYKATVDMGVSIKDYVDAQQVALDQFFVPVWGTPATLEIADAPIPGAWNMIFTDDADQAGALGYHELDGSGMPVGYVFVKTTLADKEVVSVTASHELFELLVDPAINLGAFGSTTVRNRQVDAWFAYETADAVEETSFQVDGVAISNFVYPSYFEGARAAGSDQFDYLGKVHQPFQILPGGYMSIFVQNRWMQVFGSDATQSRHARQDRRLHRSHRRAAAHERRVL